MGLPNDHGAARRVDGWIQSLIFFATQSFHGVMLVLLSTVILLQWRVLGVECAVCAQNGTEQAAVCGEQRHAKAKGEGVGARTRTIWHAHRVGEHDLGPGLQVGRV